MKDLLEKIESEITNFQRGSKLQADTGNKSAGARARKASMELRRLLKDWRVSSIDL